MSKKMMTIAFPFGGRLPAAVMETKADIPVPAHNPVDVPFDYGQQLVGDKFAYEAKKEVVKPSGKKGGSGDAVAAALAAAEKAVEEAKAMVSEAGEDLAKKADAEQALAAAEAELAKLKG